MIFVMESIMECRQPGPGNEGKVEAEHFGKGWPCGAAPRLRRNARHYLGGPAPVPSPPFPGDPATFMEEWIQEKREKEKKRDCNFGFRLLLKKEMYTAL
jgi:hypothetical protein